MTEPEGYVETAVHKVLTATDDAVDAVVSAEALLLACAGAPAESDRLVTHWQAVSGREASRLAADALTARAWAMLFAARGETPDWAGELSPLDLDAEAEAQRAHLAKESRDPLRAITAEAQTAADQGDVEAATEALGRWAQRAGETSRPDVATLAACRDLAPLLLRGALGVPAEWASDYTGTLVAALAARYRAESGERRGWRDLVAEIMRLRGEPGAVPPPATPAAIAAVERRLGRALPADYRELLLTCDGLRADVVFPRLLGVSELAVTEGGIVISEPEGIVLRPDTGEVLESDDLFGTTTHPGVRALLEEHLRLLEASV
ncbi:SMI1/KNR4 family protein [Prauserella cavernicola]|uniref:SMI1/KNR4 family protein n=1 Tax=Prauserella cavernicola TaxID=2800127 RepID=A0A934QTN9_9PSEU|nr:SMI1/KNR4 family protein [Prauserella cavernicola]MBK1786195.1 SMI1/KNR4 family protein [Prauserella cavernicola]